MANTLPTSPLGAMMKEAIDLRQKRVYGGRNNSLFNTAALPSANDKASLLQPKLEKLASSIIDKFGKVSTAFKVFDKRNRGYVTFADLAHMMD